MYCSILGLQQADGLISLKVNKSHIIKVLASTALLIFVVNKVGLTNILQTFTSINLFYLPPVLGLYSITLILGGLKVCILLRAVPNRIPPSRVLSYSVLSWAVGLFTPGKVGEFSLVYFLKKDGLEIGKAIGVTLIDKVITLSTLLICSGLGMFILFELKYILYVPLVLTVAVVLGYLLLFCAKKINSERFSQGLRDFRTSLKEFLQKHRVLLVINFILTMVKWCITGVAFFVVFASFGTSSNVFMIIIVSMTIIIINIIPITLHGLGLKEVAAIYLYGMINIPEDVAVVTSLLFSLLAYAVSILLILLFGSYFHNK